MLFLPFQVVPMTLPTASPGPRPAAAPGSTQSAFVRSRTRVNQRAGIRARCQLDVPVGPSGGLKSPVSTLPSMSASPETPWPEGHDRMAAAQSSLLSSRPMVPPCPPRVCIHPSPVKPTAVCHPPYGHMSPSEIRKS